MSNAQRFFASVLALGACMAIAVAPATAFRGHVFGSTFGSEGSGNGQLKEPSAVAVSEATGDVYVLDQGNSRIEVFDHEGKYVSQFNGSETPAKTFAFEGYGSTIKAQTGGIAVDNSCYFKKLNAGACASADPSNGDLYVTDPGHSVVDKFNPSGTYLGQLQEASGGSTFKFEQIYGVAVDASGIVSVHDYKEYIPGRYTFDFIDTFTNTTPNAEGEANTLIVERPLGTAEGFVAPGLAVDEEDNLYVRVIKGDVVGDTAFTEKYSGAPEEAINEDPLFLIRNPFDAFNTESTSAVAVDLASNEVFLDNIGSIGALSPKGVEQERFGAGHLTNGAGVAVDHESSSDSTVYVAESASGKVDVFTPEPPSPPIVVGESVSTVTGNSALFEAEVNPRGASTEYRFEYGPCATPATCSFSPFEEDVPVPDGIAGSDFEVHNVNMDTQDLIADTTYHFRIVAHNEKDPSGTVVAGEEKSFTTQSTNAFELPDGRAWEMVSPPFKDGALIEALGIPGVTQAAAAGDAITYVADTPTEAEPEGDAVTPQVLSRRGPAGWETHDIAPPHEAAIGAPVGAGLEYRFFSSDLSLGMVQPFGSFIQSLSAQASEQTPYLRNDFESGDAADPCSSIDAGCYDPLVSGCPVEGEEECAPAVAEHADVLPGTKFGEEGKCPPSAVCGPKFVDATPDLHHVLLGSQQSLLEAPVKNGLYEWSAGQLSLVSVLPQDEGGTPVAGYAGDGGPNTRHVISDDGSRVVWGADVGGLNHLYVYDSAREGSSRVDVGLAGTPEFQTATANVSEVFFTENGDLYAYDVEHEQLHRLTSGAEVIGGLPGAGEDGSYVYFVANGKLTESAVAGHCAGDQISAETECNLYVLHDGTVGLVAVLSGEDQPTWSLSLNSMVARVSPNGRFLAFMSDRPLNGYDNRDALSGKPDEELYLYDAGRPTDPGIPACVSCEPTGARPVGVEAGKLGLIGSGDPFSSNQWVAATVPAWTSYSLGQALNQSRYLSNSGRLFFNSNDALTSKDVNGTWDVYEYEPPGVGDCTTSSLTFGERSGGCVAPISSGTSPEESAFLDASETGGDVFFLTSAKLLSQDYDTSYDIYDAQECTAASPCQPAAPVQPPPCSTGDSCKAAPTPQPTIFGAPASATFSGVGNVSSSGSASKAQPKSLTRAQKLTRALKACKSKPKRKQAACDKQARRAYGPVGKAKKSSRAAKSKRP